MTNEKSPFAVSLIITETPQGTGNTGGGKYLYTFDPDDLHIGKEHTNVEITYSLKDSPGFRMDSIYLVDTEKQIHQTEISDDSIRFRHLNSKKQLTILSIRVKKTEGNLGIACDPQVTNDPPPEF
jgi:hypothetical protein